MSAELFRLPSCNPRGEIEVYPCQDDGGCWAVDHWSRNRDSNARLGTWLSLDDALAAARKAARQLEADFFEVVSL